MFSEVLGVDERELSDTGLIDGDEEVISSLEWFTLEPLGVVDFLIRSIFKSIFWPDEDNSFL
jgi:hypothetical protein